MGYYKCLVASCIVAIYMLLLFIYLMKNIVRSYVVDYVFVKTAQNSFQKN